MRFLLFLAVVLILAVLFGLIDISPLLAQVSGADAVVNPVPVDGLGKFLSILGL